MDVRDLEQNDLAPLKTSGLDIRTFLLPHYRVHLALDPGIVGLVSWRTAAEKRPATFNNLIVTDRAHPDTLLHLARFAITAMIRESIARFSFTIADPEFLAKLRALFPIAVTPISHSPNGTEENAWEGSYETIPALSDIDRLLAAATS